MKLKVGTRGSALALAQTNIVCDLLKSKISDIEIDVIVIKTKGDKILDKALDKIGDKGLFVKEMEQQLLDKKIDFAVHSLKDMPSEIDDRLILAKCPTRASEKDVLIINPKHKIDKSDILEWFKNTSGIKVGTGSKRRFCQLKLVNDSIVQCPIRGNIKTRIDKLVSEDLDAIVLAKAGIDRLDLKELNFVELNIDIMVPAAGQGALAVELRKDDDRLMKMMGKISDAYTTCQVSGERSFLKSIGAGCHSSVGAYAYHKDGKMFITAVYGDECGFVSVETDYVEINNREYKDETLIEDMVNLGKKMANKMRKDDKNI